MKLVNLHFVIHHSYKGCSNLVQGEVANTTKANILHGIVQVYIDIVQGEVENFAKGFF